MTDPFPANVTPTWALERYEQVRHRLPVASFQDSPVFVDNLTPLIDEFDVFVFDSFGVLNVGNRPIPGARERVDDLRARGKAVAVLTNAATVPLAGLDAKYSDIGFSFARHEIISSREVLAGALAGLTDDSLWGVAAPLEADIDELPGQVCLLGDEIETYNICSGFILLSSQTWTAARQALLTATLTWCPRPVLVGNPDIVAPRETAISFEPGCYAHALADQLAIEPTFYGKPFGNAFDWIERTLASGIERRRIAMIGDSLHTDILGGAAAGWRTILITDQGLMKNIKIGAAIEASGIFPDFILPSI